jgi:hypothetical protein
MDCVYNFELAGGHVAVVSGVEVICLGDPDIIPTTHPAYSVAANAIWSSGWKHNPRRDAYYRLAKQQLQQGSTNDENDTQGANRSPVG